MRTLRRAAQKPELSRRLWGAESGDASGLSAEQKNYYDNCVAYEESGDVAWGGIT